MRRSARPISVPIPSDETVTAETRRWLEQAVIGLNLCPFARAEYVSGRIRYQVSHAATPRTLLTHLSAELKALANTDPAVCETTLLIHPWVLQDFRDFNEFLGRAESLLRRQGFEGVFQLASFHPHYQFAGSSPDEITNYTNRSPHPTLHLLREASIGRAMAGQADASQIVERNLATLRKLGHAGWRRLDIPGT